MKCPVCADVSLVMSERQGIEIDYCPQCRGVWLDRGELDKIVERSSQSAQGALRGQSHGHPSSPGHGSHSHGKPYRKKSSLEELFD